MTVNPSVLVTEGPTDDQGQPLPQAVAGIVSAPPAHTTDTLKVTVGSFDDDAHAWSFRARWAPRVDNTGTYVPPSAGDTCLVIFDNEQAPWVAVYWPS
jgi:hypothetical protein